jgi:hypothetical protein
MSDKSKRQWAIGGGFAKSVVFDEATNTFDFLLEDGRHEVVSFPEATLEEIAQAIADIQTCVPVVRKGKLP